MPKCNSMSALRAALQREMLAAMEETVDKSFQDIHTNVDNFYNSGGGGQVVECSVTQTKKRKRNGYKRTGQLAESPQIDGISGGGDTVTGQLSLDTGYVYNPSGRDTETIYGYGENNGLLGQGGFWEKSLEDIEENKNEAFGKRFK